MELVHFSDCGPYRKANQDAYCVRIAGTPAGTVVMAVVCDGMGGLQCGEAASAAVIHGFAQWFDERLPEVAPQGITTDLVNAEWGALIQDCHNAILDFSASRQIRTGTTLSAILLTSERYYLMQVGDSRVYLDNGEETRLLTQDQTVAMQEYLAGRTTLQEFASDSRRNILLQCVGNRTVAPVFQMGQTPSKGGLVLCSDGFYHNINKKMIHEALSVPAGRIQLQQSILELGTHARNQGETDNMTAVSLRWDPFDDTPEMTVALMPGEPEGFCMDLLAKVTYVNADPMI